MLPTWRQKARNHTGKRFGSNLAPKSKKKRKIDEALDCSSPVQRVRFVSGSEDSDSTRLVICDSAEEEMIGVGFGPTPSVLELVSIGTARSLAKL